MLTCFQAGSAACTGVKGKETHKEEEKKRRSSFELSHPNMVGGEAPVPVSQPSKLWGAVLVPPCRLPAVPQVIHGKSLCVPVPQCHIPKISLSPKMPVLPRVESGKLPTRQQTVLSPEHGARELCSRGFLGQDRDGLWWVRRGKRNRPHTTGTLQYPSSRRSRRNWQQQRVTGMRWTRNTFKWRSPSGSVS